MFKYLFYVFSLLILIEGGERWHTSQFVLLKLYDLQKEHFNSCFDYLDLETNRLVELKNNLDSIYEWRDHRITNGSTYLHNHINSIKVMIRINRQMRKIENLLNKTQSLKVLETIGEHKNLGEDHIILSFQGIMRLQRFYEIPASEMAVGRYNDRIIGDQMNACECYVISKYCFEEYDIYCAIDWAIQVHNKWSTGDRPECVDFDKLNYYIISSSMYTGFDYTNLLSAMPYSNYSEKFSQYFQFIRDNYNNSYESSSLNEFNVYDLFENADNTKKFQELCKHGKSKRILTNYSKCRYQTKNSLYRILMPFKEEDINDRPSIKIYHDILYDDEIIKLKELSTKNLHDAEVVSNAGGILVEKTRSGQVSWIECNKEIHFNSLNSRIETISGYSSSSGENYQIVNYGLGGHYIPHNDAFLKEHMSDIENDGYTAFPLLNIISPVEKGAALVWTNLNMSNGSKDIKSLHGSCPLLKGNKWIVTKWLHEAGQILPYDWKKNI